MVVRVAGQGLEGQGGGACCLAFFFFFLWGRIVQCFAVATLLTIGDSFSVPPGWWKKAARCFRGLLVQQYKNMRNLRPVRTSHFVWGKYAECCAFPCGFSHPRGFLFHVVSPFLMTVVL